MSSADEPPGPAEEGEDLPLASVVPPRAVLTELARGFLLVHESDPGRATRFAQAFLKERSQKGALPSPAPPPRLAMVRRGVAAALRDRPRG
jgi:hypothetical protein